MQAGRMLMTLAVLGLLPAAPAFADPAAADPARLALGRAIAARLLPAGAYARMMKGSFDGIVDKTVDTMGQAPIASLAAMSGMPQDKIGKLGKTTLAGIMAILDPAYPQRVAVVTQVMLARMSTVMADFEPSMREGLAEAYAARLSAAQLGDIEHFLETPSGSAYAANALTIQTDPAVMSRVTAMIPAMMQALQGMGPDIAKATANLPPPRRVADLAPAERQRLAALLGISETKLGGNK